MAKTALVLSIIALIVGGVGVAMAIIVETIAKPKIRFRRPKPVNTSSEQKLWVVPVDNVPTHHIFKWIERREAREAIAKVLVLDIDGKEVVPYEFEDFESRLRPSWNIRCVETAYIWVAIKVENDPDCALVVAGARAFVNFQSRSNILYLTILAGAKTRKTFFVLQNGDKRLSNFIMDGPYKSQKEAREKLQEIIHTSNG
jgi:hypothetical protein